MVQTMLGAVAGRGHDRPAMRMMIHEAVFIQMPGLAYSWPMLEADPDDFDAFTVSLLSILYPQIDWARIASENPVNRHP